MDTPYSPRPWIKVQLSLTEQAADAAAVVKSWKSQRQAAGQIVRAIRLYAALLRGDRCLLEEYFPGLIGATYPVPARRPMVAAPTITLAPRSETEELDDALDGLGLDGLDFGE
jgi:hypothetical protein